MNDEQPRKSLLCIFPRAGWDIFSHSRFSLLLLPPHSSVILYRKILSGSEALCMYHIEESTLLFMLGTLLGSVTKTLRDKRSSLSPSTGDKARWGRHVIQLWNIAFANWGQASYYMVEARSLSCFIWEKRSGKQGCEIIAIELRRSRRQYTAILFAVTTAFKLQRPVAGDSSSKPVPVLPTTMAKEGNFTDTALPAADLELSENPNTAFATPAYAMKSLGSVNDTDFRQFTAAH